MTPPLRSLDRPEVGAADPEDVLRPLATCEPSATDHEAAAGAPVPDMAWFDALVGYKQAAASALLVKNAERHGDTSPAVDRMRGGIGWLLDAAVDLLPA